MEENKFDLEYVQEGIPRSIKKHLNKFFEAENPTKFIEPGGNTLLIMYCCYSDPLDHQKVDYILKRSDAKHKNNNGWTALDYVANNPVATVESFELLISLGVNVNGECDDCVSTLGRYLEQNEVINADIVKCFLKACFDKSLLEEDELSRIQNIIDEMK